MLLMLLTLTGITSAQPEQYRAVVSLLCVFKRDVKIYIYIYSCVYKVKYILHRLVMEVIQISNHQLVCGKHSIVYFI